MDLTLSLRVSKFESEFTLQTLYSDYPVTYPSTFHPSSSSSLSSHCIPNTSYIPPAPCPILRHHPHTTPQSRVPVHSQDVIYSEYPCRYPSSFFSVWRAFPHQTNTQTPSTGLRHPPLEEGARKRCSECDPNSKHWFTTSSFGGRCRKAMLGV